MATDDNKIVALPSAQDIDFEAAEWLVVLGRDDVSVAARVEFQAWIARSERHREAFEALSAMWGDMAVLEDLSDIAEGVLPEEPVPSLLTSRRSLLAMAASAAIAAGSAAIWGVARQYHGESEMAAWSTARGEQRTVGLPDGTIMQINTSSSVLVEFSKELRLVRLEAGEVHFDVARDKSRPFRVVSPSGMVEAVGTAFVVRVQDDAAVEVLVEEGVVAIDPLGSKDIERVTRVANFERPGLTRLEAGQKAVLTDRIERIDVVPEREIKRQTSWRQGMLAYSGEPLSDVIRDVSRYTDIEIDVSDPDLAVRPVAGYYKIGEMDTLFQSLELSFGIEVQKIDETHVRLSDKSAKSTFE